MAFANPNVTDVIATTIEKRSRTLADNVTNNNALLARMKTRNLIRTFSGGRVILEELTFAENPNAGWYSGYDILPTGPADVISAAEYPIKQAAVPITMSGLEDLQNSGPEQFIDLMEGRIGVGEATMANLLSGGIYSDGTGNGGKQLDGLDAALPVNPALAPYGGIDGGTFTFWQNQIDSVAAASILDGMNTMWANTVRGGDRVDLIPCDNTAWLAYLSVLQAQQRFMNTYEADGGFTAIKFMSADVVLDGGVYGGSLGSGAPSGTMFFINSGMMSYRPHSRRNMVPLSPRRRYAVNQDAEAVILAWAGNLCTRGRQYNGRLTVT